MDQVIRKSLRVFSMFIAKTNLLKVLNIHSPCISLPAKGVDFILY